MWPGAAPTLDCTDEAAFSASTAVFLRASAFRESGKGERLIVGAPTSRSEGMRRAIVAPAPVMGCAAAYGGRLSMRPAVNWRISAASIAFVVPSLFASAACWQVSDETKPALS